MVGTKEGKYDRLHEKCIRKRRAMSYPMGVTKKRRHKLLDEDVKDEGLPLYPTPGIILFHIYLFI